jgi:hypothetical protein
MIIIRLIDFLRNHLRSLVIFCVSALVLLVVGDWLLVDKTAAHTATEQLFGFWALFGFLSCVAIILLSKWFGHLGIMKPENYYDHE